MKVYCTVSSQQKQQFISDTFNIPVEQIVNYKEQDLDEFIRNHQNQFYSVLDCIGASNFRLTSSILGMDGEWVLYGLLGGNKISEFNLIKLLGKRIRLNTITLKNQSD